MKAKTPKPTPAAPAANATPAAPPVLTPAPAATTRAAAVALNTPEDEEEDIEMQERDFDGLAEKIPDSVRRRWLRFGSQGRVGLASDAPLPP